MFKRRKFKLKFRKSYQFINFGVGQEVTDAWLMNTLLVLQQKYDFDIVSTKFEDSFGNSYITIKCDKEDKRKIFSEYCFKLSGQIDHISF